MQLNTVVAKKGEMAFIVLADPEGNDMKFTVIIAGNAFPLQVDGHQHLLQRGLGVLDQAQTARRAVFLSSINRALRAANDCSSAAIESTFGLLLHFWSHSRLVVFL